MTVTFEIPDHLIALVAKILETQGFPNDDDGITEVWLIRDTGASVEEFVEAENIVDSIKSKIAHLDVRVQT